MSNNEFVLLKSTGKNVGFFAPLHKAEKKKKKKKSCFRKPYWPYFFGAYSKFFGTS